MSFDPDIEESEFPKMERQNHEYALAKGLEMAGEPRRVTWLGNGLGNCWREADKRSGIRWVIGPVTEGFPRSDVRFQSHIWIVVLLSMQPQSQLNSEQFSWRFLGVSGFPLSPTNTVRRPVE
jgi:hypothetical protein